MKERNPAEEAEARAPGAEPTEDPAPLRMNGGPDVGDKRGPLGPAGGPPAGHKQRNPLQWVIIVFAITFLINALMWLFASSGKPQIEYGQFVRLVESGSVATVQIEDTQLLLRLKEDANAATVRAILAPDGSEDALWGEQAALEGVYYVGKMDDPDLTRRLLDHGVSFYKPIVQSNPIIDFIAAWVMPMVLIYGLMYLLSRFLFRRMGGGNGFGDMMNVGKSKAKLYTVENETGVTFRDVAGQDEAKESLWEIVDFLHHPEKYKAIGARQPKGALLVGAPGTGKTLLAKAVAGEAKVPFFSLSGSEFVEMFVGVGARRVRDLFETAGKQAPCIIFIDEIDAIGKSRDSQMVGGNDEREQTLNQLLAEMDGFDSGKGIVVLAATNRPEILDKALLRPGRFDRRIIVEKPDLPGREAILAVHAAKISLDGDVNLREIALATGGATGADLANMINEGALRAVRMGRQAVSQVDLMEAVEVVVAGKEKKDRVMNPKEREMVAYHEVGHALAGALQKGGQPVQKITIIPRTLGALGYTLQAPEKERYLLTKGELLAQITTLLAGRAAEEMIFGEASTGATSDIERATKLARSMVTQYGMSDAFDMLGLESPSGQYLDGRPVLACSEATGAQIDRETGGIIRACHQAARALLEENRDTLLRVAQTLLEKETLTGAQFAELLER